MDNREKQTVLHCLLSTGAIAVVRMESSSQLLQVAEAIKAGGVQCIEIATTTPNALKVIEDVSAKSDDILVGAGTVLDPETARAAILSGANFLVTPTVESDVIEMAHRYGVAVILGAMTPTEILTAWEAGADMVKVFPASILGPGYLKAVRGPLPQILLVPTGGITADNASAFIRAGAAMVCAGGWLVDKKAVTKGHYEVLTERARQLVEAVKEARGESNE